MSCYKVRRLDVHAQLSHRFRMNMNKFIINHHRIPHGRSTELPQGGASTAAAMNAGPFPTLLRQGHLGMVGSYVHRQSHLAAVPTHALSLLVPSVYLSGSELHADPHPQSVLQTPLLRQFSLPSPALLIGLLASSSQNGISSLLFHLRFPVMGLHLPGF